MVAREESYFISTSRIITQLPVIITGKLEMNIPLVEEMYF
jgi:hypothetical protein